MTLLDLGICLAVIAGLLLFILADPVSRQALIRAHRERHFDRDHSHRKRVGRQ